ncbi:MAG: hypothetical protein WBI42_02685 [Candidatus Hydrothermia bacterium]
MALIISLSISILLKLKAGSGIILVVTSYFIFSVIVLKTCLFHAATDMITSSKGMMKLKVQGLS